MMKTWKVEVRLSITYLVEATDEDAAQASAYDTLGLLFVGQEWDKHLVLKDDWLNIENIATTERE